MPLPNHYQQASSWRSNTVFSMESTDQFFADLGTADIQHDLQTLLTRIRLAIELLPCTDPALLTAIHRDIDSCQLMIRRPFAPTDNPTEKWVVTDVNRLIQEEIHIMEQCHQATIEQDLLSESLAIKIQPLAIKRLLTNLLINAHQYGDGWIGVSSGKTADSIWFQVADNGPGIVGEQHIKLLQPGIRGNPRMRTSKTIHGSGLGLAITKKIVERHQGNLQFQQRSPQGLSITIKLPSSDFKHIASS